MKIKHAILAIAALFAMPAAAQTISPLAKAMLDAYNEILAENPNDYQTLYQRGAQYHSLSLYDQAMTDLLKAIDNTPASEKAMLGEEYSLLADVCTQLQRYDAALAAINKALELNPTSYPDIYKKGNICLYLKQPEDAYNAFSSMQRLKSRSQEAYFGMAKADIMMGKNSEAQQLMKQAEAADPTNYITFCRLGDLYMDMKDYDGAAASYLSAFGLADDTSRPVASLFELSKKNFPAVANAIDYAASKSQNKVPLYFLKGNLANATGHYTDAQTAFRQTTESGSEGKDATVYTQLARACFNLNDMTQAAANANIAMSKRPSAELMLLKADIALAQDNTADAISFARQAAGADSQLTDALITLAKAQLAAGNASDAIDVLADIIISDAANGEALLLRGYINANNIGNSKAAVADYARAAQIDADSPKNVMYKALGQSLNGKKIDAEATIEKMLGANPDKDQCYYGAVYYAQTGDMQKAAQLANKAKAQGFENAFLLNADKTPGLSLAPIRHLTK